MISQWTARAQPSRRGRSRSCRKLNTEMKLNANQCKQEMQATSSRDGVAGQSLVETPR